MKKIEISSVSIIMLLFVWLSSCTSGNPTADDSQKDYIQEKVKESINSDEWQSLVYNTYDSLRLESLSTQREARHWKILSAALITEKVPEEAEKGVLQALRNQKDFVGADSLIFQLANTIDQHTDRSLIAKTYYKVIADHYPKSSLFEKATNNLPSDMKTLEKQILDAEKKIRHRIESDKNLPNKLIKDYIALAQLHLIYVQNEQSAQHLLKAASLSRGYGNNNMAAILYDDVIDEFSELPQAPEALFQKAFMLDQAKQNDEAEFYYKQFLEKHPKHNLSSQVRILLQEVHLTDEEILERLENMSKNN